MPPPNGTADFISLFLELPALLEAVSDRLGHLERHHAEIGSMVKEVRDALLSQRAVEEWYTVAEAAEVLGKRPYTVREWLRMGRLAGAKRACGRGRSKDWMVSHGEIDRYRNEGLFPRR